jgi:Zn-dependent protease
MAYKLGDNTAKYQGRLTLNPFKHLDLFGSVVLPTITYLSSGFIIGWAKPVPFNPYNLKNQRWGEALVALAGPASNLLIALFFGILIRFGLVFSSSFLYISVLVIITNLVLAVFNLVPIPPLDGSKILFSIFPNSLSGTRDLFERYGTFILIFFIFFLWQFITPIVNILFKIITGINGSM